MTTKSLMSSLTEQEWLLITEAERPALLELDEDHLVELHQRVRRERAKYVGQYRRGAAARVADAGGRGKARPQNRRAADKAELFEAALARVSAALATAARRSAALLRAERLEAARAVRGSGPGPGAPTTAPAVTKPAAAKGRAASTKTPIATKNVAATTASGARRQAKRDSR